MRTDRYHSLTIIFSYFCINRENNNNIEFILPSETAELNRLSEFLFHYFIWMFVFMLHVYVGNDP